MNSPLSPSVRTSTVYIVEDDADLREALAALVEVSGFMPRSFASAEEFLASGSIERPSCAVVDLRLPGISGLELQARLRSAAPQLPVIVVTGHGDVATARTALRSGAIDFLEKPVRQEDLLEAVSEALAGDVLALERARELEQIRMRFARLTPRELEVFHRITDGLHNREIAIDLGISPRTVEVHRARLMEKLAARRLADLFRLRRSISDDAPVPRAI